MARKDKPPPLRRRINPTVPRYVSPAERAETRARWMRLFYGSAAALLLIIIAMAIGYTDQMPAGVRAATERVDAVFGYPVLRLIAWLAS